MKFLMVLVAVCAISLSLGCGSTNPPTTPGVTQPVSIIDQMNTKISALQAQVAGLEVQIQSMQNKLDSINNKLK